MRFASTDNLLREGISGYMQRDVPKVKATDSPETAFQVFKNAGPNVVYMVDDQDKLKGVITSSDLAKLRTGAAPTSASDLGTTTNVIAVKNSAELWQLLKLMNGENSTSKAFDQLPVVDDNKVLVGFVDRNSLRSRLSEVQIPASGVPA